VILKQRNIKRFKARTVSGELIDDLTVCVEIKQGFNAIKWVFKL